MDVGRPVGQRLGTPMNGPKIVGPRSWLGRVAGPRVEQAQAEPLQARGAAAVPEAPRAAVPARQAALLARAGVPEKVAKLHGEALGGVVGDVVALSEPGSRMEPFRANTYRRGLESFYKILGAQLELVPPARQKGVAEAQVKAIRALAARVGHGPALVPALGAVIGALDHGVRLMRQGRLEVKPKDLEAAAAEASARIVELLDALAGRAGLGTALELFHQLGEQVERASAELSPARRAELGRAVVRFLGEAAPLSGFDLEVAGRISSAATDAIRRGGDPVLALDAARAELRAERPAEALPVAPAAALAEPQLAAWQGLRDAANRALEASPTAPASLRAAAQAFTTAAEAWAQGAADPGARESLGHLATVVARLAETPAAELALSALGHQGASLAFSPEARPALARAAKAKDLTGAAAALAQAASLAHGGAAPDVAPLGKLPPALAAQVVLSALPVLPRAPERASELLAETAQVAASGVLERPAEALPAFASGWATAIGGAVARLGEGALARSVARAVAQHLPDEGGLAEKVAGMAQLVRAHLPKLELEAVLEGTRGRPGLVQLVDPAARHARPAEEMLEPLLLAAAPALQGDARRQAEIGRLAFGLADDLAGMAGDPGPLLRRLLEDWTAAVKDPARLAGEPGARGERGRAGDSALAVRAKGEASVLGFLEAHPGLPRDLALTAGLHLDGERFAWVERRLSARGGGHNAARELRDFGCGAVELGRLDLIDAARSSPSPAKAISAVIREVSKAFRAGQLGGLDVDGFAKGLVEGRDPVEELDGARVAAQFGALDLAELTGGRLDPKGVADIMACSQVVGMMLQQFVDGFRPPMDTEIKYGELRPALLDVLKNVASGNWPAPKYENEAGVRMMSRLQPHQRPVWRQEMVTPLAAPAAAPAGPELTEVVNLLRGLRAALPEVVRFDFPGLEVGFDAASLERCRERRGALLGELRASEKGSAEHRALGAQLGPLADAIAILELHQAMEKAFAGGGEILGVLKAPLTAALRPLARVAGPAVEEVVRSGIEAAGQTQAPSAKRGSYALDEDNLPALITSHKSGCLSAGWGARLWGVPAAAADANIRMLRVMKDDQQRWRTFLRFVPVKLEGYEGPMLWVENPVADGGGDTAERRLLYRHAIAKARAMGVPVGSGADYDPGIDDLRDEAVAQGLTVKSGVRVTFSFEEGNTPVQHSDSILSTTQGSNVNNHGRIRDFRGDQEFWVREKQVRHVVMP